MKATHKKIAGGVGVAIFCAALAPTLGALYAADEAVSTPSNTVVEAGDLRVSITPGKPTDWAKKLDYLAPGDKAITFVDLVNVAEAPVGKINLKTTGTGELLQGPTPMSANLEFCTVQYNREGKCPGTITSMGDATTGQIVLTKRLEQGERYYMKLVTGLPHGADNSYQDKKAVLTYTFEAIQDTRGKTVPVPKGG